LSISFSLLR